MDNIEQPWNELVQRVKNERDPVKMLQLCRELDEVMLREERRKIRLRLEEKRQKPAA